jgi:hypothetical protein
MRSIYFWPKKAEGKRPRHRWEDNIKISLREIRWEDVY